MKISIITVCYNSAATIRDTIESVIAQTYSNIEYIIVDGKSKDKTLEIVNEYKEHVSLLISEPDKGIYDAMNKGIKAATGEVVGIINSDDFFTSVDSVQTIAETFLNDSFIDATYADLVYVNQRNRSKLSRLYSSKNFQKWKIRYGFMIPHPTFYARRELFKQFGFYKLNYRVAADFELMARFILNGIKMKRIDKILVSMREGGISSNGIHWRIHQNAEIVRACKENGLKTSLALLTLKLPFKLLSFIKKPKLENV
ncbi:glycosyltransferase family 2 protein [Catenovulum sediminis]|uniref:Glycosyltransferase family 2 protein n=1 Tax=Catenovulum sediminis TaxID=1740262 RepID=A0ABV1RKK5_9ALTE